MARKINVGSELSRKFEGLDQVPAAGAIAIAAFLPIEGATGLPVRMWAIAEE